MINIISRALITPNMSGPKKVVLNAMEGLRRIGYPFVVNKQLDAAPRLWIHDDVNALAYIHKLDPAIQVVVGPNLFIWPRNIPPSIDMQKAIWLQPSEWVAESWKKLGFTKCPLEVWPAGINTDEYKPSQEKKDLALVYVKTRTEEEVVAVERELQNRNILYQIFRYGSYRESAYKKALTRARFAIWLAGSESQNIALAETLSAGVPVLVWDIHLLGHRTFASYELPRFTKEEMEIEVTSAPYFDERCGIIIDEKNQLSEAINTVSISDQFDPRGYIIEHLSMEKQAQALVAIYEKHFGPADSSLIIQSPKPWKLGTWYYTVGWHIVYFIKQSIKNLIR